MNFDSNLRGKWYRRGVKRYGEAGHLNMTWQPKRLDDSEQWWASNPTTQNFGLHAKGQTATTYPSRQGLLRALWRLECLYHAYRREHCVELVCSARQITIRSSNSHSMAHIFNLLLLYMRRVCEVIQQGGDQWAIYLEVSLDKNRLHPTLTYIWSCHRNLILPPNLYPCPLPRWFWSWSVRHWSWYLSLRDWQGVQNSGLRRAFPWLTKNHNWWQEDIQSYRAWWTILCEESDTEKSSETTKSMGRNVWRNPRCSPTTKPMEHDNNAASRPTSDENTNTSYIRPSPKSLDCYNYHLFNYFFLPFSWEHA